jgi:hypothetical protein
LGVGGAHVLLVTGTYQQGDRSADRGGPLDPHDDPHDGPHDGPHDDPPSFSRNGEKHGPGYPAGPAGSVARPTAAAVQMGYAEMSDSEGEYD